MNRKSQYIFLLGFLVLLIGFALKSFQILDFKYFSQILWTVFFACIVLGIYLEKEILIDFLNMKTTKHGMNMGTTIVLVFVLIVAVNFIGFSKNKKWDLTQEKLNSLSPQTIQIVKGLDKEVRLVGFFKDGSKDIEQIKNIFLDISGKMRFENSNVKVETYDPDKRPDLKSQYGVSALGDVVILYDGKQKVVSILNLTQPEEAEETLVNNIFVLTSNNGKTVYFLTGHNEMEVGDEAREGLSYFKKQLTDLNYEVKTLSLVETPKVPDDAHMVIEAGPKLPLFEGEIKALKEYAEKGGRLLVAADPGEKHNISKLADVFGVDFKNNFIIDFNGQRVAGSPYLAVGLGYPSAKPIAKGFKANTNFNIASELGFKATPNVTHDVIVESSDKSITRGELVETLQFDPSVDIPKPKVVSILAEGKLGKSEKEFKALFFGDSNFINNNDIQVSMLNRDLILNSVAYLADQKDLISIRPKQVKLSAMFITPTQANIIEYGFYLLLPLLCLVTSAVVWQRRRNA